MYVSSKQWLVIYLLVSERCIAQHSTGVWERIGLHGRFDLSRCGSATEIPIPSIVDVYTTCTARTQFARLDPYCS